MDGCGLSCYIVIDTYGLFRVTHSHVSAPLRSVLDMCHWHIAPYPIFAYRGIIIPLFPLISLLYNAGFHGYLLLGYVVYLLGSKKGKRILLIVPTLLVFAVCILSPVNGELRYMLPVMIMLPLNLTWCAYQERESVAEKEEK